MLARFQSPFSGTSDREKVPRTTGEQRLYAKFGAQGLRLFKRRCMLLYHAVSAKMNRTWPREVPRAPIEQTIESCEKRTVVMRSSRRHFALKGWRDRMQAAGEVPSTSGSVGSLFEPLSLCNGLVFMPWAELALADLWRKEFRICLCHPLSFCGLFATRLKRWERLPNPEF